MAEPQADSDRDQAFIRVVDVVVRIGLLVVLAVWCFQIVAPFAVPVIWGTIIAVAAHPFYARLLSVSGGRVRVAAGVFVAGGLMMLLVPTSMLSGTLVDTAQDVYEAVHSGEVEVPAPPESVAAWPFVGERVYATWAKASENLTEALEPFGAQLKGLATWLVSTAAGAGLAVVQWLFAIVIAGVLLANEESCVRAVRAVSSRIVGGRGAEFSDLAGATVRSVATGVVGVAIIQALLAGAGMLLAGVPGTGLWTLLVLVLAVAQLPPLLVLGPVAVYVFTASSATVAVLFAIWSAFVSASDTFLKPLLLGRGSRVPTLVIFVGALGGMMSFGIIGLFVGAVVLTLGYTLFTAWVAETERAPAG